jgi:hypothetical protein
MIKSIYIDLNDENSIRKAEIKKLDVENKGYVLIGEDTGFLTARLIYKGEK